MSIQVVDDWHVATFTNCVKNSLTIYEEDTKENHNHVVSLEVTKTHLLFS